MHIFSPSGLFPERRKRKNAPYFSFRFAKKGEGECMWGDGIYPPFPSRKKPSPPLPFSPPGNLWCRILVSNEEGGGGGKRDGCIFDSRAADAKKSLADLVFVSDRPRVFVLCNVPPPLLGKEIPDTSPVTRYLQPCGERGKHFYAFRPWRYEK